MKLAPIFCVLLVLALLLLNAVGHYVDRKTCKTQDGTVLQGANGPLCARIEVVRT